MSVYTAAFQQPAERSVYATPTSAAKGGKDAVLLVVRMLLYRPHLSLVPVSHMLTPQCFTSIYTMEPEQGPYLLALVDYAVSEPKLLHFIIPEGQE